MVVQVERANMVELRVVRWTKYGHDRLYVSTTDGVRVGWLDLRPNPLTEATRAADTWCERGRD